MRALLTGLALLASPAFAQTGAIPRTADGRPDLHGYWLSGFLTPMERPDGVTALVVEPESRAAVIAKLEEYLDEGEVYDPEADSNPVPPALLEMNGELRSSLIVEPDTGKLPLTSLARAARKAGRPGFDNPEDRPAPERCIGGFVNAPIGASSLLMPIQLVQTRDAVVISAEDVYSARIVALGAVPRPDALRIPGGHSRGRWEADTLIVETDGFAIPTRSGLAGAGGAYLTADSKVIERFSLSSADQLLYQFTIDDPSLYARPWRAEYVLKRIERPVYEYACHEANHALVHILMAARLGKQEE